MLLKKQPSLVPSLSLWWFFLCQTKTCWHATHARKVVFQRKTCKPSRTHSTVPASSRTKGSCQPRTTSLKHNKDKASVQQQHHQQQKRRKIGTLILILATTSHCSQLFWMWTVQLLALCQKQQQKWHLSSLIKITNWFRLIVHLTHHKIKKKIFVVAVLLLVFAAKSVLPFHCHRHQHCCRRPSSLKNKPDGVSALPEEEEEEEEENCPMKSWMIW